MAVARLLALLALLIAPSAAAEDPIRTVSRNLAFEWTASEGPVTAYVVRVYGTGQADNGDGFFSTVVTEARVEIPCEPGDEVEVEVYATGDEQLWGPTSDRSIPVQCEINADLNRDGIVGFPDFSLLTSRWGETDDDGHPIGVPHFLALGRQFSMRVCEAGVLRRWSCDPAE